MVNYKLLATLGPSSMQEPVIKDLDNAGVDLFRINLSHTKIDDLEGVITKIKQATQKPICLDTEGAQIRTGKMKEGKAEILKNSLVDLVPFDEEGESFKIPLYPVSPDEFLKIGDILYLDFNQVIIQVVSVAGKKAQARVLAGGVVGSNKGVHLDRPHNLPAFTKKDIAAFEIGQKHGISDISLSFASSGEDVKKVRSFFKFYPINVISKIESRAGIANLSDICKESDGILIDRGDLSRDVPLSKIGLAQNHIIKEGKKQNTPAYVATNLLESMIEGFQPTRAEVNDITSTLLSGCQGLVLAAETAVGKHPVDVARMAASIMTEVEKSKDEKYFDSIHEYSLIEPHGGTLVQNFINESQISNLSQLARLEVSEKTMLDVVQIAEGVYSPLQGFMDKKELVSVLENYKLPSGVVWTMPIILQTDFEKINFKESERIALCKDGEINAVMDVSEVGKIDFAEISQKWFGTTEEDHPGVFAFKNAGEYMVAGKIYLLKKPNLSVNFYSLSPKQTRDIFKNFGWKKIVGFHTRNVIHKGHEHVQKEALKRVSADALFISPVIGPKKKNDFSAKAVISSYEEMIKDGYYEPYPAMIGAFATYSRYSGPREAVFTALCRKNFGCSHFIIGRDHTGVGDYYPADASQKIFEKIGDIGIKPIMFDAVYFCKECGEAKTECPHGPDLRIKLSATVARTHLINNEQIPEYLMRPEISSVLMKMKNSSEKIFET